MSAAPKLLSKAAEAGLHLPPWGVLGKGVAGSGVRGGELLVSVASQLLTASKSAGPQLSGRQAVAISRWVSIKVKKDGNERSTYHSTNCFGDAYVECLVVTRPLVRTVG